VASISHGLLGVIESPHFAEKLAQRHIPSRGLGLHGGCEIRGQAETHDLAWCRASARQFGFLFHGNEYVDLSTFMSIKNRIVCKGTVDLSNKNTNVVQLPRPVLVDQPPPEVMVILVRPMAFPKRLLSTLNEGIHAG